MKKLKLFFSLITLLCVVGTVQAQIAVGPKIGVNLATLAGDGVESDELSSILGVQFGAAAQININEIFAIQPELLYFPKGTKTEFEVLGEPFEIEQILNYFEIPILAKVMFGEEDGTQFFATAGPSFGFGLNGKVKSNGEEQDLDFDEDMITKLDISFSIGAGAQMPAGPGNLFVDIRYLLGLNSIDDSGDDVDVKNRGVGISAGFLFPIID